MSNDERMSDKDKAKVKKFLKDNPRMSDQDLALGLRMIKDDPRKSAKDKDREKLASIFNKQSAAAKAIMELATNVPRTKDVFKANVRAKEGGKVKGRKRGGTQLGDLDKDGKMSGYEKVRQKAIQKSMAAQKNK